MLLTISTDYEPATDLGYLLHKNPARAQSFTLSFGRAHVLFPDATAGRCTVALLLEVDAVELVRGRRGGHAPADQYVNDRPYAASSFLSVAIAQVFGTALSGRSKERPELADAPIPLEARISVLPCRGGPDLLHRLFTPLGYDVTVGSHMLDEHFPAWGDSRYYTVTLRATTRLVDLLRHLYVLIPVLDDAKHYFVGADEVDKLLRKGEEWLSAHPERELIVRRYLRHQSSLTRAALARLTFEEEPDADAAADVRDAEEQAVETRIGLNEQRLRAVTAVLVAAGARRVIDLGCGEGKLLTLLLRETAFEHIVGLDVSIRSLEIAHQRLRLERMPAKRRERIRLLHGSIVYRDARIAGFDAAALVEVIEHLDPPRLRAFERVLFQFARPGTIVLTTPNREYNAKFETLPAGSFRHRDHRFEWTRAEFEDWARTMAERSGYAVRFLPVGPAAAELGAPTQMGVFTRE